MPPVRGSTLHFERVSLLIGSLCCSALVKSNAGTGTTRGAAGTGGGAAGAGGKSVV